MFAVSVESLSKSFNGIKALKSLSFNVETGSLYGLIGPDGAGKTTFMRIAACLLLQDSGSVSIGSFNNLNQANKIKRIIGYMPQRFSLYPDLSVKENLTFFADLLGVSRKERTGRIEKLLDFSRLGPFLNRRAGNLSGGMRQKLALSCTLIHTPEILFLDEPTTGVDPLSRREFWNLLAEIQSEGTTIVISTPYMDEAERCDTVGLIMSGTLVIEGSPAEIPLNFKHNILAIRAPGIIKHGRKLIFPDTVLDVQTFGDRLHLIVLNVETALPMVRDFLAEKGIHNVSIEPLPPSIEDVFMEQIADE
ncbi:ATP-binding cassette domain-containing protein [Candidatus Latescibacterota bacterium]